MYTYRYPRLDTSIRRFRRSAEGTAELVTSGADFDAIQRGIRTKYGVMVPVSKFFNTLGHIGKGKFPWGDVGVVITVSDPV